MYAFFCAFCLAVLVAGLRATQRSYQFLAVTSLGPLLVSILMGVIAATKLGSFCKTCVGLYASSVLLTVGAVWAWLSIRKLHTFFAPAPGAAGGTDATPEGVLPPGHPALFVGWLAALGVSVLLPALVYVSSLPDYRGKLVGCGKLAEPADPTKAMVKMATAHPKRSVVIFVDPLCPTCKALHERLIAEGVLENLDVSLALFPLDESCNWMVDRSVHPGACVLARAVLCADTRSREALEWMFSNQEELGTLAKNGEPLVRARVRERFGPEVDSCVDAKATKIRLNNLLQYAVANHVPVSTPQLYLGDQRVCDEDTDLGLRYTLAQLAPEVLR